jgi:predicted Holliday junction resolvase-like endonuclease
MWDWILGSIVFSGIVGLGGYILYNAWSQITDLRSQLRIIVEDSEQTERRQQHLEGQLDLANNTIALYRSEAEVKSEKITELEDHLEAQEEETLKQKGRAQSAHTSKGQILEKWAPFVDHDQIDPQWKAEDWCFLGQPIDYVVFDWHKDKDTNMGTGKVVLLDVKAAQSQLTTKQRRIRDLVKAGQVEWREIRLD